MAPVGTPVWANNIASYEAAESARVRENLRRFQAAATELAVPLYCTSYQRLLSLYPTSCRHPIAIYLPSVYLLTGEVVNGNAFYATATDDITGLTLEHITFHPPPASASASASRTNPPSLLKDTLDAFSHWIYSQSGKTTLLTDFTGRDSGLDGGGFKIVDWVESQVE